MIILLERIDIIDANNVAECDRYTTQYRFIESFETKSDLLVRVSELEKDEPKEPENLPKLVFGDSSRVIKRKFVVFDTTEGEQIIDSNVYGYDEV